MLESILMNSAKNSIYDKKSLVVIIGNYNYHLNFYKKLLNEIKILFFITTTLLQSILLSLYNKIIVILNGRRRLSRS
jgi:hypothetical protein